MIRTRRILGVALALSLVLAVPAMAGPRGGETGKRDVVADAADICSVVVEDANLKAACELRGDTFSKDNGGIVTYSGRKAAHQENAMLRQASSAVLSIDDVVTRGQDEQREMASFYLCTYAEKARELAAAGMFDDGDADLAAVAEGIAKAVGIPCLSG